MMFIRETFLFISPNLQICKVFVNFSLVAALQPYGAFIKIPGFRKQGMYYHSYKDHIFDHHDHAYVFILVDYNN
jgi:hypothetical protein